MRRVLGLSNSLRSRHSSNSRKNSASESGSRWPARPAVSQRQVGQDFVEFVAAQIRDSGAVRLKPAFVAGVIVGYR